MTPEARTDVRPLIVSSRVGGGTTFTITLPVQNTEAEGPAAARTPSSTAPASTR